MVLCDVAGVTGQPLLISEAQAQSKVEYTPGTELTCNDPGFKTPGLQQKWDYICNRILDGTLETSAGCQAKIPYGLSENDPKYQASLKSFTYLGNIMINGIRNNSSNYIKFKNDYAKTPSTDTLKTLEEWQNYLREQERLLSVLKTLEQNVAVEINAYILPRVPNCDQNHQSVLGILDNAAAGPDAGFSDADITALKQDQSWYPLIDDFYYTDATTPDPKSVYQRTYLLNLQQGIALANSKIAELGGGNAPGGQQGAPVDDGKQATLPTDVSDAELDKAIERFKGMTPEQIDSLPAEEKDLYGAKMDYDLKKQQLDTYDETFSKPGPDGFNVGTLPTGVKSKIELDNNLRFATTQLKDSRDALNAYLAKHGRDTNGFVINAQRQPLFLMSAEAFAKEFGGAAAQPVPAAPDLQNPSAVPCGKLPPQVMGRIVKGAENMKPGDRNDIKSFESGLQAAFNEPGRKKPMGTKFYDNVMEWIKDKSLSSEKQQLLHYTIIQLDILMGSESPNVFDFNQMYTDYNKAIGNDKVVSKKNGDFQKGWVDFYDDTIRNNKAHKTDLLYRLLQNMYYTRLNLKVDTEGSPTMEAMKRVIAKLGALHLEQKCSTK